MSEFQTGLDALDGLDEGNGGGGSNGPEFTSFKSGTTFKVKMVSLQDVAAAWTYSIFGKVNTFVPDKPSKKTQGGYPTENLTPFDKAYVYYKDLSKEWDDEYGKKASLFKAKKRLAFGFINLETGEPILLDFSKKQAQTISPILRKNEAKLGKKYFEITKSGESTSTVVMITPEDLDDLNAKEKEVFDKFDDFPIKNIHEAYFVKTEKEQVDMLKGLGEDVSQFGYEQDAPAPEAPENPTENF